VLVQTQQINSIKLTKPFTVNKKRSLSIINF
jgi:hypothetical protein